MLEFENQMLLDILNEDGFMIAARGLGLDQVFHALVKAYSDEGNLVFVIGASSSEEEDCLNQMKLDGVHPLPRVVSSDVLTSKREEFYTRGGVIFVSGRILVVDILKDRVPLEHVTGFLVCRAHRILISYQELFALRLYRQRNKTGFIKSFSNYPEAFTVGFAKIERVMRALFARNLLLWPRFHATVVSSLSQIKPSLVELRLQLTPKMEKIQTALLDLIRFTVSDLKGICPLLDIDEISVENALSQPFAGQLRSQVDPIWHRLNIKCRKNLSDLKTLSFLLRALTQYDCVTFESLLTPLRTTEYTLRSSGWTILSFAETLFTASMGRVSKFGFITAKEKPSKRPKHDTDLKPEDEPNLELCPKWEALSEVLQEIRKVPERNGHLSNSSVKALIQVTDIRTSTFLKQCLSVGYETYLLKLYEKALKDNKLRKTVVSSWSNREGLEDDCDILKKNVLGMDIRLGMGEETDDGSESKKTELEAVVDLQVKDETVTFTLSQMNCTPGLTVEEDVKYSELFLERDVEIIILATKGKDPHIFSRTLKNIHPEYVILYDADISVIRQLEIYQAYNPESPPHVYFMMYKESAEEQAYLTSLRKEKETFEFLIQEKASMMVPEEREGRFKEEGNPELDRNLGKSAAQTGGLLQAEAAAGRKGGGRQDTLSSDSSTRSKVIVDMREFSCELPSIIHQRGMDVEPVTLNVGDYILTDEICIERKSVNDLIGSLHSGRLYKQATAMCRCYKQPILLIEFNKDKSFALEGNFFVSYDERNIDITSRLQLLTLHFPRLRLVWSPSAFTTAELFEELKQGRKEPNAEEAAAVGIDMSRPVLSFSSAVVKFNPEIEDFISKLPGVTSKNINSLLNKGKTLDHLLTLSQNELSEIMGNSKNGAALWKGLHSFQQPDKSTSALNRRMKKSFRGRGRVKH